MFKFSPCLHVCLRFQNTVDKGVRKGEGEKEKERMRGRDVYILYH